jgi:glycosyltransferase involved in cell wall biosynthesis
LFFVTIIDTNMQKVPISIIIPTLNEEQYLPLLLMSIKKQTVSPTEIIVADAHSKDKTREIARKFGCTVIQGGRPGKARNNGAKIATQSLLLFLDADVILPPHFLKKTISEFKKRQLDAASCFYISHSKLKKDKTIITAWNMYFALMQPIAPQVCGTCIFATKKIHKKIGAFDETIFVAEDVDYIQRIARIGTFRFLKSQKITVSLRRFVEEGRVNLIMKHIGITMHGLFIGKVRKPIFKYEFGNHYKM